MDRYHGQRGTFIANPCKLVVEKEQECCVFVYEEPCRCCGRVRYVRFHLDNKGHVKATEICMDKGLPVRDRCGFDCKTQHKYPDCPLGRYEDMTMLMASRVHLEESRKEADQ